MLFSRLCCVGPLALTRQRAQYGLVSYQTRTCLRYSSTTATWLNGARRLYTFRFLLLTSTSCPFRAQAGVAVAPGADARDDADIQQAVSSAGLSEEGQPGARAGMAHSHAKPVPVSRESLDDSQIPPLRWDAKSLETQMGTEQQGIHITLNVTHL